MARIRDQFHRIRDRYFDHHFAITSTPRQEIQNHTSWAFSTSSLEWSVALVGYAMFATTAGTSVGVDGTNISSHNGHDLWGEQAGSEGDCVDKDTTQNPCSSFSCCGYVHRCWMDHSTRWHFTRWTVGIHCKLRVAAKQKIKHVSDILAFESSETVGKMFICSRDSNKDRRRWRSCLQTLVFERNSVRAAGFEKLAQIPAALVVDCCRGVYDAKFEFSRNRAQRGIDTLDEPDDNEFADDVPRDPKSVTLTSWNACRTNFSNPPFLHTCSGLRFPASEATPLIPNIVMTSYQFRASWCLKNRCWLRGDSHKSWNSWPTLWCLHSWHLHRDGWSVEKVTCFVMNADTW